MPTTQSPLFTNLSYVNDIKDQILTSGGIVFMKDNIIVASEISEAEYRELLNNPFVDKLDVLPLKRFGDVGANFIQSTSGTSGLSGTSGTSSVNIPKNGLFA